MTDLRSNIITTTDARLIGSAEKAVFSPAGTRNPACWAYGLDLTGISPWNDSTANTGVKAGVLITRRHILFAAHWLLEVGNTVRFITAENEAVDRTILAIGVHPDYVPNYPDLAVALLDLDLPESITSYKVLPSDWATYLPPRTRVVGGYADAPGQDSFRICGLPIIWTDQDENILISDGVSANPTGPGMLSATAPLSEARLRVYEPSIKGDSGDPVFALINGELVLLTVITSADPSGTNIAPFVGDINTMIGVVDVAAGDVTGYELAVVDLSGFVKV